MRRTAATAGILVLPLGLPAQQLELPKTTGRMDRIGEDTAAVAHLCVVVDGDGRRYVRASGHSDVGEGRPFEDWMPVPLGRLTRVITLAGFDAACVRGRLAPDGPLGSAVEGLHEDVAALTWKDVLGERAGGLPGYLRYVAPDAVPRPVDAVLRAHAFLPEVESAWRDPASMTPWALLQAALEREHGKPWSELVGEIAEATFGMRGVRDERGLPDHLLAARHDRDGAPVGRWLAEVPAADGAAAAAADIARLLEIVLDDDPRRGVLLDSRAGFEAAFEQPYLERTIDVPGVAGSLRFYRGARLAAFVFVAGQGSRAVRELHLTVLADLLDPAEDTVEESLEEPMGGGIVDRDRTIVGRWKGLVTRLDDAVRVELDVGLQRPVRVRVGDEGEFLTANGLRRWRTAVRGTFRSGRPAPDGLEQRTQLMVGHADGALVGFAVLRAIHPELGEVERLPCPVRFERVDDR